MARSGRKGAGGVDLAAVFAAGADSAVLGVLRESTRALVKAEILDMLEAGGVSRSVADDAWRSVQRRLAVDERIVVEKDGRSTRYRWNSDAPPAPLDALALLAKGDLTAAERDSLTQTIRLALTAKPRQAREEMVSVDRLRRVERDAVMTMAEMAMDVEENVAKGASDEAIILLVRSRMRRLRVKAVEKAGQSVPFDRIRHEPMRPGIPDGARVLVVRPGYIWESSPTGPQVLKQPLVQD